MNLLHKAGYMHLTLADMQNHLHKYWYGYRIVGVLEIKRNQSVLVLSINEDVKYRINTNKHIIGLLLRRRKKIH